MKIVRSAKLWFKEGKSDKVYEVDLVENDALRVDKRFLVNFRYGRRGSTLREGSKTLEPLSEDAATRSFESVVVSKVNEGYRRLDASASGSEATAEPEGRDRKLIARLEACLRSPWPMKDRDRLLWRIGEIRLAAAAPSLVALARKIGAAQASSSVVYALARAAGAEAESFLRQVAAEGTGSVERDLARFALCSPLMGSARRPSEDAQDLSEALARVLANPDAGDLAGALEGLAGRDPARVGPMLVALGRLAQADPALHAALAGALVWLPMRPPYLIGLRRLYKHAEMADDARLFGALAQRFETARPMYRGKGDWSGRIRVAELGVTLKLGEIRAQGERIGFSEATQNYFRRRVWRALRKRAELKQPAFAEMAAAYLLSLRPEDMAKRMAWTTLVRQGEIWTREQRAYGPFARNWSASQLLFRNAPEAKPKPGSHVFLEHGEPDPNRRDEAFPELWSARPDLALRLAAESPCEPVAMLGLRILREDRAFLAGVPSRALGQLLASAHVAVQRLAFEEARDRLAKGSGDEELLAELAGADFIEARRLALQRIETDPALPWSSVPLAFAMLTGIPDDIGEAALRWAHERRIEPRSATALVARLTDWLKARPAALEETDALAIRAFRRRMAVLWSARDLPLSGETVTALVAHPAPDVVAAGIDMLSLSRVDAGLVPDESWRLLLGSDSVEVQIAALGLFGRLGDEQLTAHAPLVLAFATAPSSPLRRAARPLVARLAARDPALADTLSRQLIDSLFHTAPDEAYPGDVTALLVEAFPEQVAALDEGMVWRLLSARAKGAQRLGSAVLADRPPAGFSVRQIARLGNHAHLSVRQWASAAYEADPARFQAEAAEAVLLVESGWPETQDFARRHFESWPAQAWTPEALAVVTDSVKPEVLAFARTLLRSRLAPGDAAAQLTRLLEHPSPSMHLVVTEMLTEEAASSEPAFAALLPLARIVMLQIGKGRIAKDRMAVFLRGEALRSRERAERILPLLSDLSLSGTERDRAAAILTLRDIGGAHPGLTGPLLRRTPPSRAA